MNPATPGVGKPNCVSQAPLAVCWVGFGAKNGFAVFACAHRVAFCAKRATQTLFQSAVKVQGFFKRALLEGRLRVDKAHANHQQQKEYSSKSRSLHFAILFS